MTTLNQIRIALKAGRTLLQRLIDAGKAATSSDALKLASQASWYLSDYPSDADIDDSLARLEGYGLMLSVRRIERVRALIDELEAGAGVWAEEARWLGRHFPQQQDLLGAVRTPKAARAWAAFHLGRSPSRLAVAITGLPPAQTGRARQRRQALRGLRSALQRFEADEHLPPLGVSEIWQILALLPTASEFGQRFSGMTEERFEAAFDALQRACQLVEAVVDGTLPASSRQQALAQRMARDLPHSEDFPFTRIGPLARQAWLDWLFCKKRQRLVRTAAQPGEV